jgi:5-methyltetrahydrofolate--homocysteine methyltransferase
VHVPDASLAVGVLGKLMGSDRATYLGEVQAKQSSQREAFRAAEKRPLLPLATARARGAKLDFQALAKPAFLGTRNLDLDLEELQRWIDWSPFFHTWEMSGRYPAILEDPKKGPEAKKLFADAQALLGRIIREKLLRARATYGFYEASREGDDLIIAGRRFPMLRQQEDKDVCMSLADFVAPANDSVGGFIVTAGLGVDELAKKFEADHDDYSAIMAKAIADRLAEAAAEWLHHRVRNEWGYGQGEALSRDQILREEYRGIRPAFGYPACPDHTPKRALFELLDNASHHGVHLTESYAMYPTASVSGLYFAHPDARYFAVGRIAPDQAEDYARRMGMSRDELARQMPSLVS